VNILESLLSGLAGGLIVAAVAYWAQVNAHRRHDRGVIRQIKALVRNLQRILWVARSQGLVDPAKWEPVQRRLMDRLSQPDVAVSLTDHQADSLYEFALDTEVALAVVVDMNRQRVSPPLYTADESRDNTKATLTPGWSRLEEVWTAFGDAERLNEYRQMSRQLTP